MTADEQLAARPLHEDATQLRRIANHRAWWMTPEQQQTLRDVAAQLEAEPPR